MTVKVYIPTPFRALTEKQARVEVQSGHGGRRPAGAGVALPRACASACATTRAALFEYINVYVNSQAIDDLEGEGTALKDGDEVSIIPAVAGGSGGGLHRGAGQALQPAPAPAGRRAPGPAQADERQRAADRRRRAGLPGGPLPRRRRRRAPGHRRLRRRRPLQPATAGAARHGRRRAPEGGERQGHDPGHQPQHQGRGAQHHPGLLATPSSCSGTTTSSSTGWTTSPPATWPTTPR